MEYGLITPLVPYYAEVFGLTPSDLGLVFAVYSLALLLVSVLSGFLCSYFGNRQIMLAGLVTLFISTISFAFADNMILLLISRFIQGAGGAAIWTSGLAEATNLFPSGKRGGRLGLMMSLTGLGTIVGPFFSGFVFKYFGYKAPFIGTAVMILPIIIVLYLVPVNDRNSACRIITYSKKGFFADKRIFLALSLAMVVSLSFGMLEPLLPIYLNRDFNLDSRGIGIFFGLYGLTFSIFQPILGGMSDRIGYRLLILYGLAGAAVLAPFFALTTSLFLLYIVSALFSIATCAVITPCLPLLADYSEAEDRKDYAKNFGLVNVAWSVGLFMGPPIGGFIDERFSFLAVTLFYSFVLVILGVGVLKIKEGKLKKT
ncbi:MAG: MFS transporter [Peptococcaceae bacterium]|nr:MFS transporter [Peptococcaceae bacterium]